MHFEQPSSGEPVRSESIELPQEDIRAAAFFHRITDLIRGSEGSDPEIYTLRDQARELLFSASYKDAVAEKGIAVEKIYSTVTKDKVEITALLEHEGQEREIMIHYRVGESLEIRAGKPFSVRIDSVHEMSNQAKFEEVAAKVREVSEGAFRE